MSSVALTANTLSTAVAGTLEYDGITAYYTPLGTQRGVVPAEQFFALNAGLAGSQVLTAQGVFGVGVTLSASTVYEFELVFALSRSAGTTSHTIAFGFGGTATISTCGYIIAVTPGPTTTSQALWGYNVATANSTTLTSAITAATVNFVAIIKGTVSINAGGTFIPQYTLSAAPGGAYTTQAGSYMKIKPIGVSGATVSVGTWA